MSILTLTVSDLITGAAAIAGGMVVLWLAAYAVSLAWHKGRAKYPTKVVHTGEQQVNVNYGMPGGALVGPLGLEMIEALRRVSQGGEF